MRIGTDEVKRPKPEYILQNKTPFIFQKEFCSFEKNYLSSNTSQCIEGETSRYFFKTFSNNVSPGSEIYRLRNLSTCEVDRLYSMF